MSTLKLIERIAVKSDSKALNHLLSYRKLLKINKKRFLISDYLWHMKQSNFYPFVKVSDLEKDLAEKIDSVYDRTLQKFSILRPAKNISDDEGPFCNKQYEYLYSYACESLQNVSSLDEEIFIEQLFQNSVIRHIKYSWKESCRLVNKEYNRYRWELTRGTIELKKPHHITGHKFRIWLEENIPDVDTKRSGEKERIQKIINDNYGNMGDISIEEYGDRSLLLSTNENQENIITNNYIKGKFFNVIADEKANSVSDLRPSIASLGSKKVKELVMMILNSFADSEINDTAIFKKFGISKATYSRFAGSDWKKNNVDGIEIKEVPDLWKNIAKVVNSDPHFFELVVSLGVNKTVENINNAV